MIINRIRHLLAADLNGVLDGVEDIVLSMKQDLREMELALEQKVARQEEIRAAIDRLHRARARLEAEVARVDSDLNLALDSGKEELARFCIRKLHPLDSELRLAAAEAEDLSRELDELDATIERQTADLQSVSARVDAVAARRRARQSADLGSRETAGVLSDEEVDLELMRRKRTRESAGEAR